MLYFALFSLHSCGLLFSGGILAIADANQDNDLFPSCQLVENSEHKSSKCPGSLGTNSGNVLLQKQRVKTRGDAQINKSDEVAPKYLEHGNASAGIKKRGQAHISKYEEVAPKQFDHETAGTSNYVSYITVAVNEWVLLAVVGLIAVTILMFCCMWCAKAESSTESAKAGADVDRLVRWFDMFDTNHDGEISREEFQQGARELQLEAEKIRALLSTWGTTFEGFDGGRRHAELAFRAADRDGDLRLHWENDEVQKFVKGCFARAHIALPPWSEQKWYDLYRAADVDSSRSLDIVESLRLARLCFEETLKSCLKSAVVAKGFGDYPLPVAERWVQSYPSESLPVGMQRINSAKGVTIDMLDLATTLQPLAATNQLHRARMRNVIEAGEHIRAAFQVYKNSDKDANGFLTWNNNEIRSFLTTIFRTYSLSPPTEEQMYRMYSTFDRDHNQALDAQECLEMVDVLMRSIFVADHLQNPQSYQRPAGAIQEHVAHRPNLISSTPLASTTYATTYRR